MTKCLRKKLGKILGPENALLGPDERKGKYNIFKDMRNHFRLKK